MAPFRIELAARELTRLAERLGHLPSVDLESRLTDAQMPALTTHLLPLVDGPVTARRLANGAEALGPSRLIAGVELAGPARMLRATVRLSDAAFQFAGGLIAFAALLASAIAGMVKSLALRLLRRAARG